MRDTATASSSCPDPVPDLTAEHLRALAILREAELVEVIAYRNRAEEAAEDKDFKTLAEIRPLLDSAGRSLRRTILLEKRITEGRKRRAEADETKARERRVARQSRKAELTFAMVDAIDRPGVSPERIDSLYAELDRWIDDRMDDEGFLDAAVNDLIEDAGTALGLQLDWELAPSPSYAPRPGDFGAGEQLVRPHRQAKRAAPRARRSAARARALNSS